MTELERFIFYIIGIKAFVYSELFQAFVKGFMGK